MKKTRNIERDEKMRSLSEKVISLVHKRRLDTKGVEGIVQAVTDRVRAAGKEVENG